ncbi:BTB/POZ domain containing protein [Rhodotorula toruloides]|uniref:BTB/POZ domain containing protein n=1 Tax=Rhodotorula toruloides TaxID=5286 RepID=A0A511KEV8_RHOTO|nr:BTB/POZ domain containing protein [Rhodotorula toruloides]
MSTVSDLTTALSGASLSRRSTTFTLVSSDGQRFEVDSAVLAFHSKVFADMFETIRRDSLWAFAAGCDLGDVDLALAAMREACDNSHLSIRDSLGTIANAEPVFNTLPQTHRDIFWTYLEERAEKAKSVLRKIDFGKVCDCARRKDQRDCDKCVWETVILSVCAHGRRNEDLVARVREEIWSRVGQWGDCSRCGKKLHKKVHEFADRLEHAQHNQAGERDSRKSLSNRDHSVVRPKARQTPVHRLSSSPTTISYFAGLADRFLCLTLSLKCTFDLLEPVDLSSLPVELVAASLKQPTKAHSHSHSHHPRCTLDSEDEKFDSVFSFPRNHTTHVRCPKHGIVHDPALALPERNSREASSFESSCSSTKSTRSLKCALKRVVSLKRP